jgi:hypothetical protein
MGRAYVLRIAPASRDRSLGSAFRRPVLRSVALADADGRAGCVRRTCAFRAAQRIAGAGGDGQRDSYRARLE